MDILKQAVVSWVKIAQASYLITYGKSKKLYTLELIFDNLDFYHLAGFQYLQDLVLPAVSRSKFINAILDDRINGEYIKDIQIQSGCLSILYSNKKRRILN